MDKRPFLYLTQEEIIDKINIDPRLVKAFTNVMKRMDSYFLVNGYYELKDYIKFFEDYLIGQDFSIRCNDEPSKIGAGGFYNRSKKTIAIDVSHLDKDDLESIICHEFIHFLVMHDLVPARHSQELVRGGFFNEALTEMLTQQIYPNSRAYEPQVRMVTFSNLLSNQVNNYRSFLKGHWSGPGSAWANYIASASKYYDKFYNKGYSFGEAVKDEDYLKAQRCAIDAFVRCSKLTDFDTYLEILDKLDSAPIPDDIYTEKVLREKEYQLMSNVYGSNNAICDYLRKKFETLITLRKLSKKYNGVPVHKFNFHGRDLALDKDGNLYGDFVCRPGENCSKGFNLNTGIVTLYFNGDSKVFDLNRLYFTDFEGSYRKRASELRKYFDNNPKKDINMINKLKNGARDLVRVEKFLLPSIKTKNKRVVYVATYTDGIEVLNGMPPLEFKDSYKRAEYIGLTSHIPEEAAIASKNTRTLDNGVVYSVCEPPFIKNFTVKKLANRLLGRLDDITKEEIFNKYRESDLFEDGDTLIDALEWYVKHNYGSFDSSELHEVYLEVINENEKVIVSMLNGKAEVSYMFGDYMSFVCDRQLLLDTEEEALFNDYFLWFDDKEYKEDRDVAFTPFDSEGRLVPGKLRDFSGTSHMFK